VRAFPVRGPEFYGSMGRQKAGKYQARESRERGAHVESKYSFNSIDHCHFSIVGWPPENYSCSEGLVQPHFSRACFHCPFLFSGGSVVTGSKKRYPLIHTHITP
jgi:hypothetical protein